ncbi:hypothetical protein B0H19DRAFT_1068357 [Mycena capillaripes]|nr:hypothetical protein B0H19DRAFT_1068357 [Mycena capillaripes]
MSRSPEKEKSRRLWNHPALHQSRQYRYPGCIMSFEKMKRTEETLWRFTTLSFLIATPQAVMGGARFLTRLVKATASARGLAAASATPHKMLGLWRGRRLKVSFLLQL